MDVKGHENRKGSSKHLKVHFDLPHDYHDEVDLSSPTGSSISSASSALSMELSIVDKDLSNPFELKQYSPEFQGSYSSPEEVSPPVFPLIMHSATPPPVAGRPLGYDPNRIPSSVFSKPSTPMEWSVASNESLFSIHVGNSSFSRDNYIMMQRSGELTKFDDLINHPPPPISTEANAVESNNFNLEKASDVTKAPAVVSEAGRTNLEKGPEHHSTDKMPPPADGVPNLASLSHRSDESSNSTRSFHFPVLAGDGGRNSPVTMVDSVKPKKPEVQSQQQEQKHEEHEEHPKMVEYEEYPKMKQQEQPLTPKKPYKAATNDWFNWFNCCWVCR